MSRTTLVRSLFARVRETLQDQDYSGLRWPELGLVDVTNWGQRALAKYLPSVGARVDTVKLGVGTKFDATRVLATNIIPGDGSTPADVYGIGIKRLIRNMGADGATPGRVIAQVELDAKDASDPGWHTEAAGDQVYEWCALEGNPLVAYVSPQAPDRWVEMAWCAEPARIPDGGTAGSEIYTPNGGNSTLLGIPDKNVDDLWAYVVAMLLLKGSKQNQNIPKSQVFAGIFVNSLNALATAETGTNPKLKLLPFADEISALGA